MPTAKKILHLTVTKIWFDKIYEGRKRWEFRLAKPYWIKRIEGKEFDTIFLRCGYAWDAPYVVLECLSIKRRKMKGIDFYAIELGNFLTSNS